ncbi:MAG TPA: LCP family protein [Candidatus Limnocylindrales bacterium]|jgi:LCP family protein required for cell wall assembly
MDQARPLPAPRPPLRRSRTLAAVLSFLIPGTGQLLEGRFRVGIFFLAPFLLMIVVGVVVANGDRGELLAILVQPTVLLGIAAFDILLFAWRAAAIVDAWWGGGSKVPHTIVSTMAVVALLAVTGATHYVVGAQVLATYDTFNAVFSPAGDDPAVGGVEGDDGFGEIAEPTPEPTPSPTLRAGATLAPTPEPTPTPAPTPRPGPLADGRLDVLLVGGDAGPGRWSLRTDTLMVLSVDERSGEAALFSIPRNMVNVPLPKESRGAFSCRCFPQMINALYVYASSRPGTFPGKDETRGLRALQFSIGELVGRKLDGMVVVELQGFVKLINAIGGLDINAPESVYDARYPLANGSRYVVVSIPKGKQHMDGKTALMYARSRHQDSDYGRMERQQIVISALAKQMVKEPLLIRLPELLEIAKDNLWTNLKTRDLPDLVRLAEQTDVKGMKRVRFIPPRYPSYLSRSDVRRIRDVVREVFKKAKPLPTPTAVPTATPSGR